MMLHCAERDPWLHVLAGRPHKSDTQQRPQKKSFLHYSALLPLSLFQNTHQKQPQAQISNSLQLPPTPPCSCYP